jgi:hypothetical protein
VGQLNPNSLYNFAHYSTSFVQKTKQHPHKQTTPTPQNRSLRSQKLQQLVEVQKPIQKSPNLPHQIKKQGHLVNWTKTSKKEIFWFRV